MHGAPPVKKIDQQVVKNIRARLCTAREKTAQFYKKFF
jgi:hypothetical protein